MHFDCILCVFVSRTWLVVGTLRLQPGLHPYVTSATATPRHTPFSGLATMSSTLTVRALYPADDVVQAFSDFAAVLAWSKAKEEDLQFVLGLIGDETMDDFMELASIPIHLIIECIGEWVKKKSPPPLQQSRLARFINVVRLKSGLEPEDLLPVPPPQAAPTPDPQILAELARITTDKAKPEDEFTVKVKIGQVLDQGSDQEVPMLPTEKLLEVRRKYLETMGGPPLQRAEVTDSQITALHFRDKGGQAPFADFGIWGPFGTRAERKRKFTSYVLNTNGSWQPVEVAGSSSLEVWRDSWAVFRTAAIMLDIASPAALDDYATCFEERCRLFPRAWHICAQADIRCRSEHWAEEFRRQAEWHRAQPGFSPYDPSRPWNSVIREAANADKFWTKELNDPALRYTLGHGQRVPSFVDQQVEQEHGLTLFKKQKGSRANQDGTRRDKEWWNFRDSSSGHFKFSRSKVEICSNWNNGGCVDGTCTNQCTYTKQPRAHICANCRQPHRSIDCRQTVHGRKGKGKGRPLSKHT